MKRHTPALVLWLLVVVADLALVVSTVGVVTALSVLAGLLVVATIVRPARAAKVPNRHRRLQ